jgi:hypothetical protein
MGGKNRNLMEVSVDRRRTGHGLGVDRYDPNLALYLPLWNKNCQPSTFYSLDNNRHLCTVTGATWGTDGYSFDGTDDYILVPYNTSYSGGNLTISLFVYPRTVGVYKRLLSCKRGAPNPDGFAVEVNVNNTIQMRVGNGVSDTTVTSTEVWVINQWNLITIVYDGTNYYFRVNDTVNTGATAPTAYYNLNDLRIGGLSGDFVDGFIGEISIRSKSLTPAEVSALYESTKWRYL